MRGSNRNFRCSPHYFPFGEARGMRDRVLNGFGEV